jgi:hypothetical protein
LSLFLFVLPFIITMLQAHSVVSMKTILFNSF